jgi:hypothetical protein
MIADPASWPEIADALSHRAVEGDEAIARSRSAASMERKLTHRIDVALDYERIGIDMQMLFNHLAIE